MTSRLVTGDVRERPIKKPPEVVMKLYAIGPIHTITMGDRMTGVDTSEATIKIVGRNGSCEGLLDTYRDFLDACLGWGEIAKLKSGHRDSAIAWVRYEAENAKEIAELRRLKEKHGDV